MSAATLAAIASGGAIGAIARYGVMQAALRVSDSGWPWGTLTANALGSTAMGAAFLYFARAGEAQGALGAFAMVGVLGAFTTFSSFALDAFLLFKDRGALLAAIYVLLSVLVSLGGFALGLVAMRGAS